MKTALRDLFPSSFLFAFLAVCLSTLSSQADDGFVSLFDGETLRGWKRLGGKATYRVEEGAIVGRTATGSPNTFLVTEKTYGDFVLELEFQVDRALNSGVQVRSNVLPNGRVGGYQVEIDPSERSWSARIYDEARRGWLDDLTDNEPARRAFKQDAWNSYRIVCVGDSIKTWINGVPAADLVDSLTLEGFIGLQVHSYNGKPPAEVRWRNIRLRTLGRHAWKALWDGRTLQGWTEQGGGKWAIENGALVGSNVRTEPRHGHLFLDTPQKDFTLRVEYKAVKGNSGLYFRTEKKGALGIMGFQAEIDATRDAGGLYETSGRGWVVKPDPKEVEKYFRPGEWNQMTVSAHGRRVVVHVNGRKSAELDNDPGRLEGWVAVQIHGGQDVEVLFRKFEKLVAETESGENSSISVTRDAESVRFLSGGRTVARYRYGGPVWKSYLAELSPPGGPNVLRDAPLDHLHHHGLMFACRVDGVNFWEERGASGREAHVRFRRMEIERTPDAELAVLQEELEWRDATGRPLLSELRTIRVPPPESSYQTLLWHTRLAVPEGRKEATLSGARYNGLGLRFLAAMDQGGRHFSATGKSGVDDTNAKTATWCAYAADAAPGIPVTVAALDSPMNPRHPSDWYTMTDPFAYLSATLTIDEKPLTIQAGKPLVLSFAVVVFHGRVDAQRVEEVYADVTRRFFETRNRERE